MKRLIAFLSAHRKRLAALLSILVIGAFFRWEIREIDDAGTGVPITRSRGVVFPWQPCGASGNGRAIKFHVTQWVCYGLIKVEASGTTS